MADGGLGEDRQWYGRESQIVAGGANIEWDEPETGREAYISGRPGYESRNLQIWAEAGKRLGAGTGTGGSIDYNRLAAAIAARRGPLEVTGRLDTPFGPAQMRGIAREEIDADAGYADMSRAGFSSSSTISGKRLPVLSAPAPSLRGDGVDEGAGGLLGLRHGSGSGGIGRAGEEAKREGLTCGRDELAHLGGLHARFRSDRKCRGNRSAVFRQRISR